MSYWELLRDPRWQKKRLEVLERENWTCEQCEDQSTELHVHHTHYRKGAKPWEYDSADLQCLCKSCHERVTLETAELHRILGRLTSADRATVLGLVRAMDAEWHQRDSVQVGSCEEADGIALHYAIAAGDVLDHVVDGVIRRDQIEWLRTVTRVNLID